MVDYRVGARAASRPRAVSACVRVLSMYGGYTTMRSSCFHIMFAMFQRLSTATACVAVRRAVTRVSPQRARGHAFDDDVTKR